MNVCVFHSSGWWGLSDDHEGANLPIDKGPWTYLRQADLAGGDGDRVGINAAQAIINIVERGYHIQRMKDAADAELK